MNPSEEVPEFKMYIKRTNYYRANTIEENTFATISEFKDCVIRGAEICFTWKDIRYGISHVDESINLCIMDDKGICIEDYNMKTIDELLDFMVSGDRLNDVITKVTVTDRSF